MQDSTLVICDIQPAYKNSISFNMQSFAKYIENFSKIVVLYVGPELDMERKEVVASFYRRNGVSRAVVSRMRWFDKGYGYLRGWMDTGESDEDIIRIGRRLLRHKVNDSRDLPARAWKGYNELKNKPDPLILPDLTRKLRSVNGATIIGGGRNECLKEVLLLADICGVEFKVNNDFVYG